MRRPMIRICAIAGGAIMLMATGLVSASGHGYTTSPTSRAQYCKLGTVQNCGQIQWEPQSVEGFKGFPGAGPADGTICAGGLSRFAELDDPRNGTWPTTRLTSGATYTINWTLTAAHATTSFQYYITKAGWTGRSRLTRGALDLNPFLTVQMGGQRPGFQVSHTGRLPSRTGRHLILAVWTIADTPMAFYQCSDVQFGGEPAPAPAAVAPDTVAHHPTAHCATPAAARGFGGRPIL